MTKKTLLTILQFILFVGLGIAIIYWKASELPESDKAKMYQSMKSARWLILLPTLLAGFVAHYFRALRWRLLLEPLEILPSKTNTVIAVLIGYLVNLFVPRMGEVAKCTVLARYEKVPADKMVGTILIERAFDVLCLLVVILFAFLTQIHIIGGYAEELLEKFAGKSHTLLYALIGLAVLIALMVFIYRRSKNSKVGHFIKGMGDGVKSILKMKKRGAFLFHTFMIWLMYWFMLMLGFWGMPFTEHLSGLAGLVVLVFGSIGMIVTQGGIGAYPVLVGKILTLYGLDEPSGLAFGWVSWMAQTGIVLVLGFIALVLMFTYNRIPHHYAATETELDKQ